MVVGVAGKLGSGKSAVAGMLADAGYRVIDVDRLGHRALVTERDRIVSAFGRGILFPDGQIDRRRLGALVFRTAEARRRLEAIVHPVMVRRVTTLVTVEPAAVVIDAALLHPMGLDALCDLVLWVRAPAPDASVPHAGHRWRTARHRAADHVGATRPPAQASVRDRRYR